MSVLYLLTAPPPSIEATDAVFQEVAHLRAAFGGETVSLFPFTRARGGVPRPLYGLHRLRALRRLEQRHSFNHIYFSVLYYFPVLRALRKPIVYTVVASLVGQAKPAHLRRLQALHHIVVPSERDADVLAGWGFRNYSVVLSAPDRGRLRPTLLPLKHEMTLLMASAPWSKRQFDEKGIDILLEAAVRLPDLRLILLWRGLYGDELTSRLYTLNIANRVEVVNAKVNVGDYLQRVHATVLLAKRAEIIRAYPHSLIESLYAGKPVLTSNVIAMADFVRQQRCGLVLGRVDIGSLTAALSKLREDYDSLAANAAAAGNMLASQSLTESYRTIYGL